MELKKALGLSEAKYLPPVETERGIILRERYSGNGQPNGIWIGFLRKTNQN